MRQTVMLLWSISIILFINGCASPMSEPKVEYINIPQKCTVPDVEEPIIDNTKCPKGDYACKASKAELNYIAQKKYAEKLKKSSEICK